MPIRPYLEDKIFEPDLITEMGAAFERLCTRLGASRENPDTLTERVAMAVISAAEKGATHADDLFTEAGFRLGVVGPTLSSLASEDERATTQ
jgi:hypothetical protein